MKRLIVMRHAKSDWDSEAQTDHERPLNDRGKREAPSVGARLRELRAIPELVVSSDSTRTRETWERIQESFPKASVEFDSSFYLAGLDAVRARLRSASDRVETILVLGHNPGWEEMASELAGKRIELKTAYAAVLDSDAGSWSDALEAGVMRLHKVVKPTE